LLNQINALKSELDQRNKDINNLNELIAKIQDDKCKQSKKINKMLENGLKFFFFTDYELSM